MWAMPKRANVFGHCHMTPGWIRWHYRSKIAHYYIDQSSGWNYLLHPSIHQSCTHSSHPIKLQSYSLSSVSSESSEGSVNSVNSVSIVWQCKQFLRWYYLHLWWYFCTVQLVHISELTPSNFQTACEIGLGEGVFVGWSKLQKSVLLVIEMLKIMLIMWKMEMLI